MSKKGRKTKSKPKAKKAKRKLSILRALIVLGIIGSIVLAGAYFWIDGRVEDFLTSRTQSDLSAVYSAPYRLSDFNRQDSKTFLELLRKRNYRETTEEPRVPGDYRLLGNELTVYIRDFKWVNHKEQPAALARVDFSSGKIFNISKGADSASGLALEPTIVASLSDQEYRASNYKKLADIPEHMKKAIIAIEDERFYDHFGVDPQAILRAFVTNIASLDWVQGGSTLTQQLAKNTLFSAKKTLGRKLSEVLAAISLERRLTKDQILEMYLNEIYLGQEGSFAIHGVAEASQVFFGKRIADINVAEAAMLAGIIKAPSYFSPRKHFERAETRKELTLEKMKELGYIGEKEYNRARSEKVAIVQEARNKRAAPFFIAALEQELAEHLNLEASVARGINIYTGLNTEMQACADKVLEESLIEIEKQYPKLKRTDSPLEGALVAIEPASGLVKAWAGGRDFSQNQFNHVNQAIRQVGSTIKPFLYLTALDSSLNTYKTATVTSVLSDEPMQIKQINQRDWTPENYDKTFKGDVTLRYALENSLNLPAVYIAQKVGLQTFANTVSSFNIADKVQAVPSLALGTADTTPLRLTAAYAALANGGIYVAPRMFISAEEKEGETLAYSEISERRVAEEAPVFVLTDILRGVVQRGTARAIRSLGFEAPAAGKTGTSNEARDAWFIGFTPQLSIGIWIGYDDNKKIGLTGGGLAAPIWAKFMKCSEAQTGKLDFIPPSNVIGVDIDGNTLEKAGPGCPSENIVREIYVSGTEPREICSRHNSDNYEEIPEISDDSSPDGPRRKRSIWDRIFG